MERDERFMRFALEMAREAAGSGEVPVGAVIVSDDVVIGRGRNSSVGSHDPAGHAEIVALRDAGSATGNYRLTGATLYSTVEPCLMCLGASLHARIGRLVYGADDPKLGCTQLLAKIRADGGNFNHEFEVSGGTLKDECSGLLIEFFRSRRQNPTAVAACGEVPKWS